MTGQPECWLVDDDVFRPDYVPICHGAPYQGRKHERVRMKPVENRPYFRCEQCGSRASVGEAHE